MTAIATGRLGDRVEAVDLFCGFGGSSQGIHAAGADVRLAANHNQLSLDCHAANFPETDHCRADLSDPDAADYVDPADLPPAAFLWASPSCKHHSPANARKVYAQGPQGRLFADGEELDEELHANSERSRVTMMCPLRYAARHRPEIVVVENVLEVTAWGPGRDGSTFRWWLEEWGHLGYEHEALFLNSMFFAPCPQSRDRIYIVLWRRGNRRPDLDYRPPALCCSDSCGGLMVEAVQTWKPRGAGWPLPRWGKYRAQYVYTCPRCRLRVEPVAWPAYTAIDWLVLGPALGERATLGMRPLAPATVDRIRRGLTKFRGGPPVVIPAKAVWGVEHPVHEPFRAQTTQRDRGVAVADGMVIPIRTGGRARGAGEPMPTAVAGNVGLGLATGALIAVRGRGDEDRSGALHDQVPTLTSSGRSVYLATEGVVVPAAGNTHERPGQTRARSLADPLFTQHTTRAFGFAHAPYLTTLRGAAQRSTVADVAGPLSTVSAGGEHHGLTSPALFAKFNGGPADTAWHHDGEPLNAVTARDTHGLVVLPWVDDYRSDPQAITEQLATVMTHARQALASVEPSEEPITDEDLERVRFRMLEPDPELRRAMAFTDEYRLLGNKTQRTAGLGNAVTPPVASWITERCLATLRGAA